VEDSGFSVWGIDPEKQNAEASRGSPRFTDALSVSKSGGQTCVILQFWGVSFDKHGSKISHGRFWARAASCQASECG